jgi:hypothetical protein
MTDQLQLTCTIPLVDGLGITLLQDTTTADAALPNGAVRMRVPFYVGNSTSKVAGFSKKVLWSATTLPSIVQEGNRQIAEGKQPLTVYARHSHAMNSVDLPIGDIVNLEQEGSTGYAILEVLPTDPHGKNIILLAESKKINAVSLRSMRFDLTAATVNGESMLVCEGMCLDGIDFAPNGPAQPTFGIQILQEEATVTPDVEVPPTTENRSVKVSDTNTVITLEDVPADVREAIEAPLRAQLKTVTTERNVLVAEKDLSARDEYLRMVSSKSDNPEEGFKALVALCEKHGAVNTTTAAPHVTPFLLAALDAARTGKVVTQELSVEARASALFGANKTAGNGKTSTEATGTLSQEKVSPDRMIGGLVLPEGN